MKYITNLDKEASRIFAALLEAMKDKRYLKIENDPFMPLTIALLNDDTQTPYGVAKVISLYHHFYQNGELMQDPEMQFYVIDNRTVGSEGIENLRVIPYYYFQANLGVSARSIQGIENDFIEVVPKMQADQTAFANEWLRNIRQQGFLKIVKNGQKV